MKKNNSTEKNVVAVIQARMGSTRLPGKALHEIMGLTLIEWIRYRLSFCKEINGVVFGTADNAANDPLAALADRIALPMFRGSETDLIARLLNTARAFHADAIVRITGDCPLVDPTIVDRLVARYRESPDALDYVTNVFPPTFPDGMDVEVLPLATLERLDREVTDPLYREWITTTILKHPDAYRIANIADTGNHTNLRLTVDYLEDMALVEAIISRLHVPGKVFTLTDILALFEREPALVDINRMHVDGAIVDNIRSAHFHQLTKKNKSQQHGKKKLTT